MSNPEIMIPVIDQTIPDVTVNADSSYSAGDLFFMRYALRLALRAAGKTHPNPIVGAVIVRDGRIVGEGWHQGVGTDHAETMAFAAAGEAARGATLYVTLEPCAHFVSSTGIPRLPCAERSVRAGVKRVFCAMEDPDTRVSGNGFAHLRAAGIEVTVGLEQEKAQRLNLAYIRHRRTGLPYVLHKAAMTLDGKLAASDGSAKWITGEKARRYVHRLRNRADAIVVGVGTILADDPELTTRLPSGNGRDPLRVLFDSRLRTPLSARVVRPGTLILTAPGADPQKRQLLIDAGVEVEETSADLSGKVDVLAAMRLLADRGKFSVLLESGGTLAAAMHCANLVNRVLYFIAPRLIGGQGATPIDGSGIAEAMSGARETGPLTVRRFGSDIAITAEVGDIVVE